MLTPISEIINEEKIAGIHSIPINNDGTICMVWDKNEKGLTTIGGRREPGENLEETLDRETREEAGILLHKKRVPVASWYWESTDTYTVFVIAKVKKLVVMPTGYETAGKVSFSFDTAKQMVRDLEGPDVLRIRILELAEKAVREGKLVVGV